MRRRGRSTGRVMRWTVRGGWTVAPTPYEYHIGGLHFFQRLRFKGAEMRHNWPRQKAEAASKKP